MGGSHDWILGVALNIIGSISINAGTNLMKLGHNRRARDASKLAGASASAASLPDMASKQKGSNLDVCTIPSEPTSVSSDDAVLPATRQSLIQRQDSRKSAASAASARLPTKTGDGADATATPAPTPAAEASAVKPIYKYAIWVIGSTMFVLGNVLNFASFGFAAQSLLSALGAIQFVSNVVFARFVLGEPVTWFTLLATAIIVGACMLLVFFGSHVTMTLTADLAMELYTNPAYYAYLIAVAVLAPLLYVAYLAVTRTEKRLKSSKAGAANVSKTARALTLTRPFLYASYSALIGTQSVLFGKTTSELIQATARGNNQFTSWYTYIAMLCLLITAVFWMYHLNKGLRLFPAVLIVPTLQIMWTLLSIVSGGLYFQEFKHFTPLDFGMFALGVVMILTGVVMLTVTTARAKPSGAQPRSSVRSARSAASARPSVATAKSVPAAGAGAGGDAESLKAALALTALPSTQSGPAFIYGDVADDSVKISVASRPRVHFDSQGPIYDGAQPAAAPATPGFVRREPLRDTPSGPVVRRQNSRDSVLRQLWRESKELARQSVGLDDDTSSLVLNLMGMPVAATPALHFDEDADVDYLDTESEDGATDSANQTAESINETV